MDVSSSIANFIFSGIPYVWILFYTAALLFVLAKPSDSTGAKNLATIGAAILLFGQLTSTVIRYVITFVSPADTLTVYAGVSVFDSILGIVGTSLIIAAVFKGRSADASPAESFPGQNRDTDNPNPFQPPSY